MMRIPGCDRSHAPRRTLMRLAGLVLLLLACMSLLERFDQAWAQPHQSQLRGTDRTVTPTPTAGPSATPTATPGPCIHRVLLQDGLAGYQGTRNTWINEWEPSYPQSNSQLKIRGVDAHSILMSFDLSQIEVPVGAQLIEAQLVVYVEGGTRAIDAAAFRLLRPWSETMATWYGTGITSSPLWGAPGCNDAGFDRIDIADDTIELYYHSVYQGWNVTDSVRYWLAHPEENYGWLIKNVLETSNGLFYVLPRSAEQSKRPILRLDFDLCGATSTPTPSASATLTLTPDIATATATSTVTPTVTPTGSTPTPTRASDGIACIVYEDLDRDGVYDTGEPGIESVLVELYDRQWQPVATELTDANGLIVFGALPTGEYRMWEHNPKDYWSSTEDLVPVYHGGLVTLVTFGDFKPLALALPYILASD